MEKGETAISERTPRVYRLRLMSYKILLPTFAAKPWCLLLVLPIIVSIMAEMFVAESIDNVAQKS